ncbi:MAG: hypothetical protein M1812_001385 [Candelaria pacifica]|nr:MAG: hypothetical protein M1812_001385 [Candelaria pacifica]
MLLTLYQGVLAAHFLPRQIDTSLLPALTTAIESVLSSASASASTTATSSTAAAGSDVSGLPSIPECSEKCFTTAIQGDGCEITDIDCHCSKEGQLRDSINPCLVSNCAPQDRADFDHAIAVVCQNATSASSATATASTSPAAANNTAPGQYVGYVSNATTSGNKTNLVVIATAVSNSSSTESSSPTSGSANTTTDMGSSSTVTSTASSSPSETGVMSNTSEALATIHAHGGILLDIMLLAVGWAAVLL